MLTQCTDELPNPHKNCIRDTLSALVCHDNDFRRVNVELRNLNTEYRKELDRMEIRSANIRPIDCEDSDQVEEFSKQVATWDDVNQCFAIRIENLEKNRLEIRKVATQCLNQLIKEKAKFKQFHENTIENLKRHSINSDDHNVKRTCEKDICEMQRLFVRQVTFIKKCEEELLPFLQQLEPHDYKAFCMCCCFKEYEWIPKQKCFEMVDKMAEDIKTVMGMTLRRAFGQLHIHQPENAKRFLAGYLMNVEENEELLEKKLHLFKDIK